jgi:predicted ATPase/DNA-binding XRE family transcriptional regulator
LTEISFGEWLKRQRGAKGWTQRQLAQKLNCSFSALRKMEAEERHPSVQVVERLIEIFQIPQSEQKSFLQFARGDWQAFLSGETEDLPWHGAQVTSRSNLPASITSFVGREKEQEAVIQLTKKNRLVTIAGVGGIGKTRLCLQVGHRLLNHYPEGIWFIPLDSLSNPALVPQTVASVFDIRESPERSVIEILKKVLHQKTTLLILDNCEHLLDACAQLALTLLTYCPNLKILVTSRETLNVEGEAIYHLPSLAIPEQDMSLETLTEYESVKLFTERAALVVSSFSLTRENAQSIVNICRRVDGMPLAIELAAARVNMLSIEEISKQLQDSYSLLASHQRITLPRHQTLLASMNWSWGLLSEAEQIFMQQLSIFAGGWTLEASQAVCDGDVLSLTEALVKKSLIVVDQRSGRETRYRFHEIVHQYAYQKLVESDE